MILFGISFSAIGGHFPSSWQGDLPSLLINLYGTSGTPLPNYFVKGRQIGLTRKEYTEGKKVFLHHNKAAGSTVKNCLTYMQKRGIIPGSQPMVVGYGNRLFIDLEAKLDHLQHFQSTSFFMGGYSFGICDYYQNKDSCSYFTFMRDPIDRVISSYVYCHKYPLDQLCGPATVRNFTLEEWAISQGSYFFYQLLLQPAFCKGFFKVAAHQVTLNDGEDFIMQRMETSIKDIEHVFQCWVRQRRYFQQTLSDEELQILLDYMVDNMENWFALIGLTENFTSSLEMLSHIYKVPFETYCDNKANKGQYRKVGDDGAGNTVKDEMRSTLEQSPGAMEALNFDFILYDKGKEIFERQLKLYLEATSEQI